MPRQRVTEALKRRIIQLYHADDTLVDRVAMAVPELGGRRRAREALAEGRRFNSPSRLAAFAEVVGCTVDDLLADPVSGDNPPEIGSNVALYVASGQMEHWRVRGVDGDLLELVRSEGGNEAMRIDMHRVIAINPVREQSRLINAWRDRGHLELTVIGMLTKRCEFTLQAKMAGMEIESISTMHIDLSRCFAVSSWGCAVVANYASTCATIGAGFDWTASGQVLRDLRRTFGIAAKTDHLETGRS